MAVEQTREATLGILTFLLLGAATGASILLFSFVTALDAVGDVLGAGLRTSLTDGDAFVTIMIAFLVMAPLVALFVAALMGARAARTGHTIGGTAALTALYGIPLLWVNVAVATLLSSALLDGTGATDRFDDTFDMVVESIVPMVLVTAATIGFAALAGTTVRDAFLIGGLTIRRPEERHGEGHPIADAEPTMPPAATTGGAAAPAPAAQAFAEEPDLVDYPVDCPRCRAHFTVTGSRPLRILCPECGKSGMIR